MSFPSPDPHRPLRLAAYALLAALSLGDMTGRILAVRADHGRTPFQSANDRSRWSTVRALVDHGTYALDDVIVDRDWRTIDMVKHLDSQGRLRAYSSKPPLLATLVAGQYWVIRRLSGLSFAQHPFYVARIILILTNVLPWALFLWLLIRWVERWGESDAGRLLVMAAAAMGTLLSSFSVTLNNHTPAAIAVLVATALAAEIGYEGRRQTWRFFLCGLAAAFAVTCELPALSFFALLTLAVGRLSPRGLLLGYLPAAALILAAAMGTTYLAHGDWQPPYAHRHHGPLAASVELPDGAAVHGELAAGRVPEGLRQALSEAAGVELSSSASVSPQQRKPGWILRDGGEEFRLALLEEPADGGGVKLSAYAWDDWYEYDGSYWAQEKTGVDRGEPSRWVYAANVLVGHHGVFSLTPIWLLSVAGVVLLISRSRTGPAAVAWMTALLTVVCLAFYLARPIYDRNYGGVAAGFRWLLWLAPLWLVVMLPAADAIFQRPGRGLKIAAVALLALSVLTASYAGMHPWSHPWIYNYWVYIGWVKP